MKYFKVNVVDADSSAEAKSYTQKRTPKSFKNTKKFKVWASTLAGALILVGMFGGYIYQTNRVASLRRENERLANPKQVESEEIREISEAVGKLIELPNETPTIATVIDATKLKNQTFFANAQNGDKVLIFAKAKKAILYRPSSSKIVEVAPLNIGDDPGVAGATTTTPTQNKKP